MNKIIKTVLIAITMISFTFAAELSGRVTELAVSSKAPDQFWFIIEDDGRKFTVIERDFGESRSDKMFALLLGSKVRGGDIMFDFITEDGINKVKWIVYK